MLFSLVNNITISVFSSLINFTITMALKILINPRKNLEEEFKKEERKLRKNKKYFVSESRKREIHSKIKSIFEIMKIRNIIFITVEFILMMFFFYFITAFCCVFKSTQTSWLLDWVVSFFLSILLELVYSVLISSLYTISITYKLELIYNIVILIYKIC